MDLYAYSLAHIPLDINPLYKHVVTRVHTSPLRPYSPFLSLLPPSLSLLLARSLSLSPLGHRRSTIDASSLPASARIYGNVYAGRSYIRGF